ncbi:MAG: hypothetical protein AAF533_17885 [Acidobacteriota bacterium]
MLTVAAVSWAVGPDTLEARELAVAPLILSLDHGGPVVSRPSEPTGAEETTDRTLVSVLPPASETSETRWPEPAERGPGAAFRAELREHALRYRDTSPWSYAPESHRDDRNVRRGRAKAAEKILSRAAEEAVETWFEQRVLKKRTKTSFGRRGGPDRWSTSLKVSRNPRVSLSRSLGSTHVRVDLPLSAHQDISVRCGRSLSRRSGGLSTTVAVNPWNESARVGLVCDF